MSSKEAYSCRLAHGSALSEVSKTELLRTYLKVAFDELTGSILAWAIA